MAFLMPAEACLARAFTRIIAGLFLAGIGHARIIGSDGGRSRLFGA